MPKERVDCEIHMLVITERCHHTATCSKQLKNIPIMPEYTLGQNDILSSEQIFFLAKNKCFLAITDIFSWEQFF